MPKGLIRETNKIKSLSAKYFKFATFSNHLLANIKLTFFLLTRHERVPNFLSIYL